jgi:hypothetical protein
VTSQINVKFTLLAHVYKMSGSKVTRLYSPKNNWYVICDKKNLPCFVMWYDFYLTHSVFSISSPRIGDRKHKTRWIKIISNHKPWEILYVHLTYFWMLSIGKNITVTKYWSKDIIEREHVCRKCLIKIVSSLNKYLIKIIYVLYFKSRSFQVMDSTFTIVTQQWVQKSLYRRKIF